MKIVVITNCSKRKKQKVQQDLMALNLEEGLIDQVSKEWSEKVKVSNQETLPARDQYVGRSFTEVKKIEKIQNINWYIISAGLGLIDSEEAIPSYDLTITNGSSNSILKKFTCNSDISDWWKKVNEVFNQTSFPIAELIDNKKDTLFLFALTKSYFNLIKNEFSKINDKSKIRLFGYKDSSNLDQSVKKYFLPYNSSFDGPDSENKGIKNDFPRRVMRHYVEQIISKLKEPDFEKESKMVTGYLSDKSPPKILKNKKFTDEYILEKIKDFNREDYPTHRDLLKHFRHELGIACEESRFKILFGKGSKSKSVSKTKNLQFSEKSKVDKVISLSDSWKQKPHRKKLSYFIPEWDDLVDPDYDFLNDVHSGGKSQWANEVYAHQMFPEPNYDGILVSRAVAEKSKWKKELINKYGVHRLIRVPKGFPVMGDCGAFDYIMEEVPPYSTDDVLNYYTDLGFDFGVSVDHLIVKATLDQWQFRYDLTINNAEEFLQEHRARGLKWTPVGAVQGWDPSSYAKAAKKYVKMGYNYLALGGLVRSTTKDILYIVDEVRQLIPKEVRLHLFGIARPDAIPLMIKAGVDSIDSASHLRRAWLGAGQNYFTENGDSYAAIRIPQVGKSFRSKRIVSEGRASKKELELMESECLRLVREFDKGKANIDKTLDALCTYDQIIAENRNDIRPLLEKLLNDQPWKKCPCDICKKDGVEVIIFRGNNRNRRRGFHNTYVFYRMLQEAVQKGSLNFPKEQDRSESPQTEMNLGL